MAMIKVPEHIKAVLFDLDGTLVDSMSMWKGIDIQFLGRYGLTVPDDLQKAIEGMSFCETAEYFSKRFPIPATPEEMMDIWNQMAMDAYANTVPMKPGALEFLAYLKTKGIRMGIVTSNSPELLNACLQGKGIAHYFDTFVDGKQITKGKPAPDGYLLGAERIGVAPENCLVVEDIPFGIMAGNQAGMTTWAIEDAYSEHLYEEKKRLADGMISSYLDVCMEE